MTDLLEDGATPPDPPPDLPPEPPLEPPPDEIPNFTLRVLAVLGTDETVIAADIVALPEYRGRAERFLRQYVERETLEAKMLERYESALVYQTALTLLPYYKMQVMKIEQAPHGKIERFEVDWAALENELQGARDECLKELTPELFEPLMGGSRFVVTNRRR